MDLIVPHNFIDSESFYVFIENFCCAMYYKEMPIFADIDHKCPKWKKILLPKENLGI